MCVCVCVCVCFLVFVAFSRRSRKPPERKSAIFAERNCNSSPNFSFFLSPMTGAFAKSSRMRAKLLCGSFEPKQRHGVSASTKKYTVTSLPL